MNAHKHQVLNADLLNALHNRNTTLQSMHVVNKQKCA